MRHQIKLLVQQDELSRQQEQSERLQDALSRQQEQSERLQDELSRQQEQSELQQDELSRQQEQSERLQDELSGQQEQSLSQQESLNQNQETLDHYRDELNQHLLDITHGQDQASQLQNQIQAQHESNQELDVRFSALARSVGFEHAQNPEFDRWYQNLQDLHRGSGEALAKTQSSYLPYFESLSPLLQPAGPILDLGCGRGEWLSLLAMQGWQVRGVDSSELVVEVARENGLDVQLGDLLTVLEAQPANSLAAVTAFQVIEHLPFECIVALVHSAFRALLPGGILLLETPNPENIQVAAYSFWMDPTHKKPIPPPLVMDLSYHAGFRDGLVLRQNPWPNWDQTPAEPSFEGQMNQRLFGPQDYAVLAYKPVTPS
jgi:O-antigen chain-terminating methyltransferase